MEIVLKSMKTADFYLYNQYTGDLKKGGNQQQLLGHIYEEILVYKWLDLENNDIVLQVGKQQFCYSDKSVDFFYRENCFFNSFIIKQNGKVKYEKTKLKPFMDIVFNFDITYDKIDRWDTNSFYTSADSIISYKKDFEKLTIQERKQRIQEVLKRYRGEE